MPTPAHSPLKPKELVALRSALEAKRDELIAHRRERIERVREARGEQVGDEMDEAELGEEAESLVEEAARQELLLLQIERALERMHRGTYGMDENTGRPISLERLRAVPWATEDAGTAESRERRR